MTLEITQRFPQDAWNETFSSCDFSTLKACRLVSKKFTEIVETSSVYILERFHLDNAENGKLAFRRIIYLGDLFQEWTKMNTSSYPKDLFIALANWKTFNDYLLIGVNQFNYLTFTTEAKSNQCGFSRYLRAFVVREFIRKPLPSSIREILTITQNHIRKNDDKGLAIRAIVYMTPHVSLRDHPAKKDLIDLFANNLNDLPLLLNYNPEKADALLNQDFTNLASDHIKTLILSYLCNHDVKRVQNLLCLIKEKGWTYNADLGKEKPGLQKILTSSYDDEFSPFLELLLLYKREIEGITEKTLVSHVCTSGNALLLKKLRDDYNINLAEDAYCFHYASNAEIAQILFESGANIHIHQRIDQNTPLATALLSGKSEVAAFLIDKNAHFFLHDPNLRFDDFSCKNPLNYTTEPATFQLLAKKVKTFSLIRFLIQKGLKETGQNKELSWIALKEVAYRIGRIALLILAPVGIIATTCPGTLESLPLIVPITYGMIIGALRLISEFQYEY